MRDLIRARSKPACKDGSTGYHSTKDTSVLCKVSEVLLHLRNTLKWSYDTISSMSRLNNSIFSSALIFMYGFEWPYQGFSWSKEKMKLIITGMN